jgi:hypothetical protein
MKRRLFAGDVRKESSMKTDINMVIWTALVCLWLGAALQVVGQTLPAKPVTWEFPVNLALILIGPSFFAYRSGVVNGRKG